MFRRGFSSSFRLLEGEKSALEVQLRDGLKSAMKQRDKASTACLKVSSLCLERVPQIKSPLEEDHSQMSYE